MPAPCGDANCPVAVATDELVVRIQATTLGAGSLWWRGTTYPPTELVPGIGDTRFAPLVATAHAYIGSTKTVALLESALHDAAGPHPVIFISQVKDWSVHQLQLTRDLRVADLRDDQLDQISLSRTELVNTTAAHYPCTRRWAAELQTPGAQDRGYDGMIWHSRQADLHARIDPESLMADVLHHVAAEVAVLWSPPGPADPFEVTGSRIALVENGQPTRFLAELAFLIGASLE